MLGVNLNHSFTRNSNLVSSSRKLKLITVLQEYIALPSNFINLQVYQLHQIKTSFESAASAAGTIGQAV